MASNTKDIRRRIKSIKNTSKITKAMEMVSAAKMRKSVASVLAIRPYAHSALSVLTNLARSFDKQREGLLEVREVKNILIIVVTSNRGLCGSFNAQIVKKIKKELADIGRLRINRIGDKKIKSSLSDEEIKINFITIGRKGEATIRRMSRDIVATFPDLTYLPKVEEVRAVSQVVIEDYLAKKYDKVAIIYTDYVSAINQQTKIRQVLPISKVDIEKHILEMSSTVSQTEIKKPKLEYKIEPSPKKVLDYIFPRLIEMQIYHAILESNASKEAARMMAMRNATEAAGEMAEDLTLMYNQIRQQKITQEIAEIAAGRAALEN
jgi:F-type H+-transporting ATPase subunit gamma